MHEVGFEGETWWCCVDATTGVQEYELLCNDVDFMINGEHELTTFLKTGDIMAIDSPLPLAEFGITSSSSRIETVVLGIQHSIEQ